MSRDGRKTGQGAPSSCALALCAHGITRSGNGGGDCRTVETIARIAAGKTSDSKQTRPRFPMNTQHLGSTCRDWLLAATEHVEDYVLKTERRFRTTMHFLPEQFALRQGAWRAKQAADRAWGEVPAYHHFLAIKGVKRPGGNFGRLPIMDKENYVKAYRI